MRIAAFCHRLDRTGAPIILHRLLRALAGRHEVTLLASADAVTHPPSASLLTDYEAAGIPKVDVLDLRHHDVLLANTLMGGRMVARAHRLRPTVWWIHEPRSGHAMIEQGKVPPGAFQKATRIVFPTWWQGADVFASQLEGRTWSVVPYGIDTDPAPQPCPFARREGEVHLLHLGMVSSRKGNDLTIVALERLNDPRIHVHMVGSLDITPLPVSAYRAYVEARPFLKERVHFHGSQPEKVVNGFIQHCDFMLFPTRDDLITLAILEGLFFGKCIISSDFGPIPETLIDGETGLLVPVDDAEALAGRIRQAADDPALVAQIGRAGRAIYERKHSFAAHLAGMEAELEAAIADDRAKRSMATAS